MPNTQNPRQQHTLRMVSRKSALALWQAEFVKKKLNHHFPTLNITISSIITEGDRMLDTPLYKMGGKGLFVKELEQALLDHRADIAVHSMKDVPALLPQGLVIAAILKRADPRDVFISNRVKRIAQLPKGASIGTSSLRRQAQLAALRPDLCFYPLRGNIDTRLHKLDQGQFDAIILAAAGLERLNLTHRITEYCETSMMLPGIGQGALGIECRSDDHTTQALVRKLHHPLTGFCLEAERSMNAVLGGNCQLPIAGLGTLKKISDTASVIQLEGFVGRIDGQFILKATAMDHRKNAVLLGQQVGEQLRALGAEGIIEACASITSTYP